MLFNVASAMVHDAIVSADLGDDVATKVTIVYYSEVKDALVKALME